MVALGFLSREVSGRRQKPQEQHTVYTQIFVYLECLGGGEQKLMEMLALLRHPMSNMRLFLNERPQTTAVSNQPQSPQDSTPEKASRIPGVLQYTTKSTKYTTCEG